MLLLAIFYGALQSPWLRTGRSGTRGRAPGLAGSQPRAGECLDCLPLMPQPHEANDMNAPHAIHHHGRHLRY